jgi:hypothetical protein
VTKRELGVFQWPRSGDRSIRCYKQGRFMKKKTFVFFSFHSETLCFPCSTFLSLAWTWFKYFTVWKGNILIEIDIKQYTCIHAYLTIVRLKPPIIRLSLPSKIDIPNNYISIPLYRDTQSCHKAIMSADVCICHIVNMYLCIIHNGT